jgi:hypothetical protein
MPGLHPSAVPCRDIKPLPQLKHSVFGTVAAVNDCRLCPSRIGRSVDTRFFSPHLGLVMAKPRKIEEPASTYSASRKQAEKPSSPTPNTTTSGVRYLDSATAGKLADKIFTERKNLLHKLAQ